MIQSVDTILSIVCFYVFQNQSQVLITTLDEEICEEFVLSQSDTRLLKDLVPLAMNDSVLRKCLLALASRHLANRWQLSHRTGTAISSELMTANRNALIFKHHSIKALSSALRDPAELGRDTIIASVYILILLDLLDSGSSGWQEHLEGGRALSGPIQPQTEVTPAADLESRCGSLDLRKFLLQKLYLYVYLDNPPLT